MAATDKPLRDQNMLDIVFAVSSVAMLVSAILMFAQDYFREWKPEQRVFREVESLLAQRAALQLMPSTEEIDSAEQAVEDAKKARESKQPEVADLKKKLAVLEPDREKAEAALGNVKADVGSVYSLYYIDLDHGNVDEAKAKKKQIEELETKLAEVQAHRDRIDQEMKGLQSQVDAIDAELTRKLGDLKKVNDKFDAAITMSLKKQWTWGDRIRSWPIIDGFASPFKIQQITNNDYGINYNFKDVTRFDRCTTCHLGIDRPAYTHENLRSLIEASPEQLNQLEDARDQLINRRKTLSGLPEAKSVPDPASLRLDTIAESKLTKARINQFAAHPRLDLFVGSTSKHPMEKFGCTTCHNGQGSSTSFHWASHTPNNGDQERHWTKELGWGHIHAGDWEFPMNAKRFAESACLKCHYQVTDLISSDNKNEAPKVLRGYNLIRENGCFGCHEIAGRKGGRDVGPDMRLESTPPLVDLTATERHKIESDLDNRPGNLRKVGPSLYRIAEKTNEEFTRKWVRAPREFRPDTKMPHFYGVSNNNPHALAGTGQEAFPDAELHALTHYLFTASNEYLRDVAKFKDDGGEAQRKDTATVLELTSAGKLNETQKKTLEDAQRRIRLRSAKTLQDLTGGYAGDAKKGRAKFIERGCLSCHSHQATEKAEPGSPAVVSEAQFGPNLSQLADKLGKAKGDTASAKIWLVQWLLDPQVYSPRSRMPITGLTTEEAADIATWLLAQPASDLGPGWKDLTVPAPKTEDLQNLARVYMTRVLSAADMKVFFDTKELSEAITRDLPAEEKEFVTFYKTKGDDALKHFVGKRAVGRQGCYACHDIPGFDSARPIGVALNDWGKKDANKLAFEDIANFFLNNYFPIERWTDEEGRIHGPRKFKVEKDGKTVEVTKLPYEEFFSKGLMHGHENRESYLFMKLNDPRAYDYERVRAWDDRSRMPQFRFARLRKKVGESDAEFQARSLKEEADAREAVATFVLGLVAEAVPLNMINRPSGDRLAEVKGRQTLDNFNCSGCHLIRPGSFEVKANDRTLGALAIPAKAKRPDDHVFPNHYAWTGKLPGPPDGIGFHGILPQPPLPSEEAEESDNKIRVRLMQALRFVTKDKAQADIPAATTLVLSPEDFTYPPPSTFQSPEKIHRYLKDRGQFGGTFGDLLVDYLAQKDPKAFPRDPGSGDSSKARPLVPPSLVGQGERTRPEWLYEFLLNPFPVRKMTVLRMPKFNLSPNDAQSLVDYFGGVERMQNPGIGLTFPFEQVAQQDAATDYFKQKSAEYVARLKTVKVSQGGKDVTMFDKRVQELTPIWQSVLKDLEDQKAATKTRIDAASAKLKEAETKEKDAQKKLESAKANKDDKAGLAAAEAEAKTAKAALDAATRTKDAWDREAADLTAKVEANSIEKQKQAWMQENAYLTDAFKLVANKTLCWQCHQVNGAEVKNEIQGPPLTLSHSRLRPGWTERWIANPNRFLPYASSMPVNFPNDQPNQFQEVFAGTPLERVQASRDVLMVLPQASQIPANRYWLLPLPGDVK
jgi:cytochrome c2